MSGPIHALTDEIARFQLSTAPLAVYSDGFSAAYDPAADSGGALGDLLNIVVSQASDALASGCRYAAPLVRGRKWRYAKLAAKAGLCNEASGWNCLFTGEHFPALGVGDKARQWSKPTGPQDLRYLKPSQCADGAFLRNHSLSVAEGYCPLSCTRSPSDGCGRDLLVVRCSPLVPGSECPASRATEAIAALLARPDCSSAEMHRTALLRLLWAFPPALSTHVAGVRAAALPVELLRRTGDGSTAASATEERQRYVGVHIRRGDACRCLAACCWSNQDGAGRSCVATEDYISLATLLAEAIGARHVFVATEDPDEAVLAARLLRRAGLTPLSQSWRRDAYRRATRYSGASACKHDGFTRIERAMDSGALDAEGALLSAVADVQMLAEADALVGGISAFTTLAQRLGSALAGTPQPMVDIGSAHVQQWLQARWEEKEEDGSTANTQTGGALLSSAVTAVGSADQALATEAGVASAARCPASDEVLAALDANDDGQISPCELRPVYRPLSRLRASGHSSRESSHPSSLAPSCASLYHCLEAPLTADESRHAVESSRGEPPCEQGDLGPFPCLEEGCEAHGVAITCGALRRGGACEKAMTDVWKRPQHWAAGMLVSDVCPVACGRCGRDVETTPAGGGGGGHERIGSCDASF
jgi:hypothetical protein